jgi:hypothetical protein
MLRTRVDAGEQFPQGIPTANRLISRYMELNVEDRNHIRDALESANTLVAADDAVAASKADNEGRA